MDVGNHPTTPRERNFGRFIRTSSLRADVVGARTGGASGVDDGVPSPETSLALKDDTFVAGRPFQVGVLREPGRWIFVDSDTPPTATGAGVVPDLSHVNFRRLSSSVPSVISKVLVEPRLALPPRRASEVFAGSCVGSHRQSSAGTPASRRVSRKHVVSGLGTPGGARRVPPSSATVRVLCGAVRARVNLGVRQKDV